MTTMTIPLEVTIELREAESYPAARLGTIRIGGVDIFTDFVYDTDENDNRTEEQACKNLLLVFGRKLKNALEENGY